MKDKQLFAKYKLRLIGPYASVFSLCVAHMQIYTAEFGHDIYQSKACYLTKTYLYKCEINKLFNVSKDCFSEQVQLSRLRHQYVQYWGQEKKAHFLKLEARIPHYLTKALKHTGFVSPSGLVRQNLANIHGKHTSSLYLSLALVS